MSGDERDGSSAEGYPLYSRHWLVASLVSPKPCSGRDRGAGLPGKTSRGVFKKPNKGEGQQGIPSPVLIPSVLHWGQKATPYVPVPALAAINAQVSGNLLGAVREEEKVPQGDLLGVRCIRGAGGTLRPRQERGVHISRIKIEQLHCGSHAPAHVAV